MDSGATSAKQKAQRDPDGTPSRNQTPDLTQAIDLTSGAIERLQCPEGKKQAFLRDSKAPGLRVRVTVNAPSRLSLRRS
ncbi:MAG: hypothetical protein EON54_07720 [Alcaligenaceae bacterium]|nr:MAG: hypothetical protein EON54_07720 [Alcaligenaceae bacterium]